jgi:tape measure domain-containing protein
MNRDTAIKITAKLDGRGLDQLKRGLQGLSQQSTVSKRTLDQLYTATRSLGAASGNTIASLRGQAQALGMLRDTAEGGSRKFRLLTKDIEAVETRLRRLQATSQSSGGLSRGGALLAGAAGGVAGALAVQAADLARQGAQGVISVGVNAETAQVRLKALTDQFGEYNEAQASAARIADTLRISQLEASDGFSKLYAALRPTGITLQEVEDAFIGFTAAARASGATATESTAALLQLKQALGSGVLQGDELRSIREQAPAVGQAIAKEMGVTIGELKKLGSEGKITTDIVIRALAKLRGEKLDQLREQFNTSAQAIKDLQVAMENAGATVARVFGPAAVATLRGFTAALDAANLSFAAMTGNAGAQQVIEDRLRARQQAERDTNARPFGIFDQRGRQQFFRQREEQLFNQFQRQRTRGPEDNVSPEQQQNRDEAAAQRAAGRARAAAEAAKKLAEQQKKDAEKAEKEREKVKREQIELNQLLQEQLRLNSADGAIGKDRLSQLNGQLELLPEILKYQIRVIELQATGTKRQLETNNATLAAKIKTKELKDEVIDLQKEVQEINNQAAALRVSTLSGLLPRESPLAEEIKRVKEELQDADRAAEELLTRLSSLAGTNPVVGATARATIGNLRGDLATADPNEVASQRLVQPDIDALKEQVTQLQNAGKKLTTLDELVLKYGADWDQIDPKVRASLQALAEQKDKLEEINKVNEKQKELFDSIAESIGGGIGSAFDSLIEDTENWGNSLKSIAAGVLKDIARQLIQISVVQPIVQGIKGLNLQNILPFADGGVMTRSGPLPLKAYARGGIANTPQLALYGEGAMNEAYVPLPDGRRIPVALQGGTGRGGNSVSVGEMNITVQNTGETLTPDAQKQIAGQVQRIVLATLINQKRSGGIL